MLLLNIQFKRIEIANYHHRTGIELKITLDAGKLLSMSKMLSDQNPEAFAEEVIKEARLLAKKNAKSIGEDFLDDVIIVKVPNEDEVVRRMAGFFNRLKEKSNYLRGAKQAAGYVYGIENFKRQTLEF